MSSSDPENPDVPRPTPRDPDQSTDPGRSRPFESLYRDPDGALPNSHRTTARHYEPSLSPPDEQPPGDVYHWLYRPEPDREPEADREPESTAPDVVEPVAVEPAGVEPVAEPRPSGELDDDGPPTELTSPPQPDETMTRAASPAVAPPPPAEEPSRSDAGHASRATALDDGRRRMWPVILLALVLVGAGVAIALTIGQGSSGQRGADPLAVQSAGSRSGQSAEPGPGGATTSTAPSGASPSSLTSSSASATASTGSEPYVGGVLPLATSGVTAECQAPPATDGQGRPVRYDADQLTDGDASTAWRCEGDGDGEAVVFSFAGGTRIAELGLINGYTKIDTRTKADRYGEYRRILVVKWTFANGSTFNQALEDGNRSPQKMRIPVQTSDQVRLTIVKASPPGGKAKSRDAVLASEATFGTPQG